MREISPHLSTGGSDSDDDDDEEEEENNPNASNAVGTGGPHPCVVCKAALEHHGQSRPLPKHQASQYGLQVSDFFHNPFSIFVS